jgi:hypothetical protein
LGRRECRIVPSVVIIGADIVTLKRLKGGYEHIFPFFASLFCVFLKIILKKVKKP